ncbi:MOP flippase family protein [Cognatazoarcus halotolerans]|uniref:MOP flippase family protein n=1 Tax=Cognatazoarcus halotolerans TaxID=2686016 RepID=UPI00135887E4|nr:MOP flippase family protein [Cognatazoarcus halotolerans]
MASSLARIAARGVLWTGFGQVLRQVIQVVSSVVLARLLLPADFGLLGMAIFFVGFAQLFADFGIGSAIIHRQELDQRILSSSFWFGVIVSAGLAVLVSLCAEPVAAFYGEPSLVPIVLMLSINLILTGAQAVPMARLQQQMRFADAAKAQVLSGLIAATTAIVLAFAGFGVWALVFQPIVGSTVMLALMMYFGEWRPSFTMHWPSVRSLLGFSGHVLSSSMITYATRNVDQLLIGRFIGQAALGVYSLAYQIMLYPLQHVSSVIVRVLFPTLSQIRGDVDRFSSAYLAAVGVIAFITFPLMAGLFAVADDFVVVVFGDKWVGMVLVLKVFAWLGMMQSIATTVGTIYLATGETKLMLKVSTYSAPVLIGGMVAGLYWGIEGVAVGYTLASFGIFYFSVRVALGVANIPQSRFYASLARPLCGSIVMVLVVMLIVHLMSDYQEIVRLVVAISSGVVSYVLLSFIINKKQTNFIINVLRNAIRKVEVSAA